MSWIHDFKAFVLEFDEQVFGQSSSVLSTHCAVSELDLIAGPTMFFQRRQLLLEKYPKLLANEDIPASNFYLIQEQELGRAFFETQKPKDHMSSTYSDYAIKAVLCKISAIMQDLWGGPELYVAGNGLFTAKEIVALTSVPNTSEHNMRTCLKEMSKKTEKFLKKVASVSLVHNSVKSAATQIGAQNLVLFKCVQSVDLACGREKTFASLKRLLNHPRAPQRE